MESIVTFDDIVVEGIIEVPTDEYAEYLQEFTGDFWFPSPGSHITQQELANLQEVMGSVSSIELPDAVSPVVPMVPLDDPNGSVATIPPDVMVPEHSVLEMSPLGTGNGEFANPQLDVLPGDLLPGFDGDFQSLPSVEAEEEEEEEEEVEEEVVAVQENEEIADEVDDLPTPAGLAAKIVDHLVIRDELWYFCHFSGQSVYSGRFVLSTVLQDRMDLRVHYWEEKAHLKAGFRNKRKLDAIVHERGKLVIKENKF